MKPGKLPGLDLMLSPLTIGCWSFGGDDASYWGEQNQQDIKDVVDLALDLGVNCFDTAIIYNNGQSEAALGGALAAVREQVVIIDKIPLHPAEKLSGFEESVTGSLKRLRTGYIDIMTDITPHIPTKISRKHCINKCLRLQ
jgi:aryl-alcohol dehydrogenase-like predicted oxidoreductase